MAKIFDFANGIFLPFEMGFSLSFELRLVIFIAFVKEKGQTLLVTEIKKSISNSKNKISFEKGYFFAI